MYYFIRVNGKTTHNNPNCPISYVEGEPLKFPNTYFNYLAYCLENNVIRIGWPDVGDLVTGGKKGALASGYDLASLKKHVQAYLAAFREIRVGDVVITTDKDLTGHIYIGTVTKPYCYFHSPPNHPYECAHRVGVAWDRDSDGHPQIYHACDLSIPIRGGFWTRAFRILDNSSLASVILPAINDARKMESAAAVVRAPGAANRNHPNANR